VNKHQATALGRPCRLSIETLHPRFGWMTPSGLTVILTVNSGYE
jgi:hypothetical protein